MLGIKKICKLFNNHSVAVSGEKGSGKDLLMSNVIARRKSKYYISNTDYNIKGKTFIRLNLNKFMTGNTYIDFINNTIKPYIYPYRDGIDIYISDCGVYFPCQYNNELNRQYKEFPTFMALSRHLGDCYVHTNCQALTRVWDKIREQSSRFILCKGAKVLFKRIVVMKVRVYENRESAEMEVQPFRSTFTMNKDKRERQFQEKTAYLNQHGKITTHFLIFKNKSNYNTRMFKELLENEKYT